MFPHSIAYLIYVILTVNTNHVPNIIYEYLLIFNASIQKIAWKLSHFLIYFFSK